MQVIYGQCTSRFVTMNPQCSRNTAYLPPLSPPTNPNFVGQKRGRCLTHKRGSTVAVFWGFGRAWGLRVWGLCTLHAPICYNQPAPQPKDGSSTATVTTNFFVGQMQGRCSTRKLGSMVTPFCGFGRAWRFRVQGPRTSWTIIAAGRFGRRGCFFNFSEVWDMRHRSLCAWVHLPPCTA